MVYPALLPLMRTPRLPVVDRTEARADLNGLVRFAESRNLVSARAPSHFKCSLHQQCKTGAFHGAKNITPSIFNTKFYKLISNIFSFLDYGFAIALSFYCLMAG
jgi:hypothetical protein